MKKAFAIIPLFCLTVVIILSFSQRPQPVPNQSIIHRKGNKLVKGQNEEVLLQGISFGNEVWTNKTIPLTHHSEADFKRVADMGMNVIRFYLNYKTFEDDDKPYIYKNSGWEWIDQNIAWAKKYKVYLILNIHVPPGGFQSNGGGGALWENGDNQKRLKALWHAIAKKYAAEPLIAGYDLLNEPVVTQGISQWQQLAQELADTIRRVDKNHLLIVERLNAVNKNWNNVNEDNNFFLIRDDNTMYTFHFYLPFKYTHQYASWAYMGEGGKYPDESVQEGAGYTRNKAYLEKELDRYLAFGRKNNVPLYLGEFGLIYHCFKEGKGGLEWTADMLDILQRNKVHYTYHVYHEDNFGLYHGYGKLVDTTRANHRLIELFRKKLKMNKDFIE
jgi:aryl-phospho-beta-D-glucosidase BglC (GH1 family)